ncbi:MAG TPA: carbohydrate-binding family 9-like protein [Candidatus Hydrogenedentes bacterium]|nr:carbohydrate-binding family 9-like protein [Candidatus Hydrogenedentota bacterium]
MGIAGLSKSQVDQYIEIATDELRTASGSPIEAPGRSSMGEKQPGFAGKEDEHMLTYSMHRTERKPALEGDWDGPVWQKADTLSVDNARPESSDHHPTTRAKLLYDADCLYVLFDVADRYVRCTHTRYQDPVCQDSCVEFFVRPKPDKGYFNFEVNCGGTLLLYYIEDPTPTAQGFAKFAQVSPELGRRIPIYHSMPDVVDPEIPAPTAWRIEYAIPLELLEHYVGTLGNLPGQQWRANFYKCADLSSHPHWISWAPFAGELNFHQPEYFSPIRFEK